MRKLKITLKCGKDLFRGPEPTKEEFKVLRNKMEELFEDLTALKEARNNLKNRKSCIRPGKLCQCLWQKREKRMRK